MHANNHLNGIRNAKDSLRGGWRLGDLDPLGGQHFVSLRLASLVIRSFLVATFSLHMCVAHMCSLSFHTDGATSKVMVGTLHCKQVGCSLVVGSLKFARMPAALPSVAVGFASGAIVLHLCRLYQWGFSSGSLQWLRWLPGSCRPTCECSSRSRRAFLFVSGPLSACQYPHRWSCLSPRCVCPCQVRRRLPDLHRLPRRIRTRRRSLAQTRRGEQITVRKRQLQMLMWRLPSPWLLTRYVTRSGVRLEQQHDRSTAKSALAWTNTTRVCLCSS